MKIVAKYAWLFVFTYDIEFMYVYLSLRTY